jgi:hypothetical protein
MEVSPNPSCKIQIKLEAEIQGGWKKGEEEVLVTGVAVDVGGGGRRFM